MKWTIYDKAGKVKHESLTNYDGNGNEVCQDKLEYSGKWMGESYLTVSIKTAYPIDFQIGDYIEYRGEKFCINYDPTVIKKSRRGAYGEGFVYDNIKFNSYSNELTMMRFHDWALSDNELHYSSLPTFSFYAKDVDDLVDRLQACANRWCKANSFDQSDYWMFYTLANNTSGTDDSGQIQTTYERTVQRAMDISTDASFTGTVKAEWIKTYGTGADYADSRDDERYDRNISISGNSVWEGLQKVKTEFGLNFIIRGRNVYVGTAGIPTSHLFKYGKGNGLYEIDKAADSSQNVVTRLHAYGSDENLPTRYYAELGVKIFATIANVYNSSNESACSDYKPGSADYIACFDIKMSYKYDEFTTDTYYDWVGQKLSNPTGKVVKFHLEGSSDIVTGVIAVDDGVKYGPSDDVINAGKCQVIVKYNAPDATQQTDWQESDQSKFKAFSAALLNGKKIIFDNGVKSDAVSSENKDYQTANMPDNMAVNSLMLPGFPNYALSDICRSSYDSGKDVTNYYITNPETAKEVLFHSESGRHLITYSNDRHDPYIVSQNASEIGYRDGDISCTESNDDNGLEAVYPTIEEITAADAGISSSTARLDAVVGADTIDDNGVFDKDNTSISGFHITLPELGFDLRQAAKDAGGSEMKISMKDGFCGGRTFSVTNCTQQTDGTWKIACKRSQDTSLDLWFPYSYAKSVQTPGASMANAYQILAGDHYVLTGIAVSSVNYIWAASVRLLRKAIHWLCKNDYTRYVFTPKIDEIFMARQSEEAKADKTETIKSLHDTIKEGDLLLFADSDLMLNGSVYIDQLSIKENGNKGIPTYEVTLRDEVNVGTIQRIQNKVDSISNDIRNGNIGNGGVSALQVEPLIQAYGKKYFLSKLSDDTAQGLITFAKGLVAEMVAKLNGGATFGNGYEFDKNGNVVVNALNSLTFDEALERGFGFTKNASTGKYTLSVTDLMVWGKAVFNSLEIRKLYAVGGNVYLSGASSKIQHVVAVTDTDGNVAGWKCYILNDDGTTATQNGWVKYDQAKCQTFDIAEGVYENVSNTYYWRLVTDVSAENEAITETVTETSTDEEGNETTTETTVELYDGKKFGWIILSKSDCESSANDEPKAGDTIVLDGHRMFATGDAEGRDQYNDESRTNVMMLETTGTDTGSLPRIVALTGITDYKHSETSNQYSNTVFILSPKEVVFVSSAIKWVSATGDPITFVNFRGAWTEGTSYAYYDQVSHDNAIWTCIAEKGTTTTLEPTDANSAVWRKEISGGKGEKGDDAVTYGVQVSPYYYGSSKAPGLWFDFTKTTGAKTEMFNNVTTIGCAVAIYADGTYYSEESGHINGGAAYFLYSSYPNDPIDTASVVTVMLYHDGILVATTNIANGKEGMGAMEISVSPDTVIFDTDDNGLVSSSASKTATISCYRDGKKVENVEYALPSSGHPDCNATISTANSIATVTISGISTDATYGVSKTSGTVKVQVYDVDNGRYYYPTVKFAVNVAKFNGSMVANNKKFETVYNELTNNGSSTDLTWYESKIEQTARNISLKVQEKNVGRRNLLVGSAFRKQESGFCNIIGGYISINGGYEGINCVRAVNQYSGTQHYYGVFWDGSQGGSSVKIERGKKYILSVWVKCDNVNATIALEPIFTDKQTSATRTSARPKQTKQYFKVTNANEWELLQSVIDTSLNQDGSTNTLYDCLAVNVWCSHALSGVTVNAWFSRPMLEEGEEYNGWTQSEQDYDYVGGNLLDNTGTLTESGNLATVNGTVTEGGMGESASIKRTLPTTASEIDPLAFSTSGMGIKAGEDYILSFYAKADSDTTAGKLQCFFHPSSGGIYTEDSAGGNDNSRNPSDGNLLYGIVPTTAWKRYWVHWRPTASDMQYVRFRVYSRGTSKGSYSSTTTYAVDDYVLYNGTYWRCKAATKGNAPTSSSSYWEATVYDVSIAQPKLEVGATMTEWTEKRADMVDKQALLATGIDIDNKIVTVTADKFRVQNNSGEQTALVTADGKLTTSLIDADTVVAQGIKTQELEAQNLKVTGNSKFGIWSIGKDDTWGDVIQASDFTDLNGVTYTGSMMQYTPSFVRGGNIQSTYMRVGPYTAEFGQYVDNGYNGIWFGYAARVVCQGSNNSWDLPTGYVYNAGYSPTAYIYNTGSGENPAFAINRTNGGAAIKTNGAVRCRGFGGGVTTVSSSTTLDNNAYFVRCTNSSSITVTLPSNPVEGQTVIIAQAGGSVSISGGSKTIWARGQTGGTSSVTSGMTGQFNIFVYDGTRWNATMMNGTY